MNSKEKVALLISEQSKRWLIKVLNYKFTTIQVFEEYKKVEYEGWTNIIKHSRLNTSMSVNMWGLKNLYKVFYIQKVTVEKMFFQLWYSDSISNDNFSEI